MGISTDYLVVGAGTSGLAFVDALVAQSPDAEVVVVDRNERPGGHWLHAYPFVRLHSPSWFYGVDSRHLGEDRVDTEGLNEGMYERADKAELVGYFAAVAESLVATGRVRFLHGHDHSDGVVRSVATGETVEVAVRRRVVDARYLEASVPATHRPSYEVAADAWFVPVGALPEAASSADRFVVLGAGKTAADACLWLLEQGTDPDRITWVRPRDAWWHDRSLYQGLARVGDTMTGLANDAEAIATATDLADLQERLEAGGNLVRLDATSPATMFRGGMLSRAEADQLRRVANIVRLGHVQRVERDRVVLDGGDLETGADAVVVDCTAKGLRDAASRPIWAADRITLQQVRHNSPPFNAALVGWLEAHRDDDEEKNRLCPPNPYAQGIADYAPMLARTWLTEAGWLSEPDLTAWVGDSRLNLLRDLPRHQDDAAVQEATQRFVTHIGPAMQSAARLA